MAPPAREDRNAISVFAALAAVAAFLVATLGVIVAVMKEPAATAGGGGPISVSLTEFAITPATINAPAGEVTLAVTNDGGQVHNLEVVELGEVTPDLQPGESATLDLGELEAGSYKVICNIPGHEASGMVATLVVGGPGGEVAAGGHGGHGAEEFARAEEMQAKNIGDYLAAAAETGKGVATEGEGNVKLEPRIGPDGAKEFDLEAKIVDFEVSPGKVVQAWTYNGQVPGPWIRVEPGDLVRVNLTNSLPDAATDIHFHGITTTFESDGVSPLTQPMVMPGEDFTYEFRVPNKHEMGMFHAHMHGDAALPNGMYGVFQVGDTPLPRGRTINGIDVPGDLQVTQELPMVLNDAGVIGLSLNGKSWPATDPIIASTGDAVLVHYHNEGLQIHPMHLHHVPQLVVAKDGFPLEQPYWVDTLNVAPGERYSVLILPTRNDLNLDVDGNLKADEALGGAGIWAFHCHILNHAEGPDGLFGMVTVMVVLPSEGDA